jgi:UDP-sugar transporter A1/2/3
MAVARGTAWILLVIIAVQFASQPLLTRHFVSNAVSSTSLVFACELVKLTISLFLLISSNSSKPKLSLLSLSHFKHSLLSSGVPALLYTLQNSMVQVAYRSIDSMTFNLLNQTKIVFSALFLYLIAGRKQSALQVVALCLLMTASVIVNLESIPSDSRKTITERDWLDQQKTLGVVSVLCASILSGISTAASERTLRVGNRNQHLFNFEMAVYSLLLLQITSDVGFTNFLEQSKRWSLFTWIPVLSQALGGLCIGGLVRLGAAERKSFAIVIGLLLTAALQSSIEKRIPDNICRPLSYPYWIALFLVVSSLWMHSSFPHKQNIKPECDQRKKLN